MGFVEPNENKFSLPPVGLKQAVCCEVLSLGASYKPFRDKDTGEEKTRPVNEIRYVFQLNAVDPDTGKRFEIWSKPINLTMDDKGTLKSFMTQWRGHDWLPEELKPPGFMYDDPFIGKNAMISVIHVQSNGKTYANIGSITPLMEGLPEIQPLNYESHQDQINKKRAENANGQQAQAAAAAPTVDGPKDNIPF